MTNVLCTIHSDFEVVVDIRDAAGKARRVKTLVSCEVPVVADMPAVAKARKPNGWTCTWKGRDGATMRPLQEILRDRAGVEQPSAGVGDHPRLGRLTRALSENDLSSQLPIRHELTDEPIYSASDRKAVAWTDERAWRGCDLSAAAPRVEEVRRNVPHRLALQDGVLHLANPLPSWWVNSEHPVVQLTVPHGAVSKWQDFRYSGGHHVVWTYAADRLDAAMGYQHRRHPGAEVEVRGAIEFLDPAYAPGTNLPDLAGVVCSWLLETVKYPIADLPAAMVRRWHDLALGSTAAWHEGPARAAEILQGAVSFAEDLKAYPDAFRGRGSSLRSHPFWRGFLDRLEVEGIRAQPMARPPAVHAPGA